MIKSKRFARAVAALTRATTLADARAAYHQALSVISRVPIEHQTEYADALREAARTTEFPDVVAATFADGPAMVVAEATTTLRELMLAIVLGCLIIAVAVYFWPPPVSNAARAQRTSSATHSP